MRTWHWVCVWRHHHCTSRFWANTSMFTCTTAGCIRANRRSSSSSLTSKLLTPAGVASGQAIRQNVEMHPLLVSPPSQARNKPFRGVLKHHTNVFLDTWAVETCRPGAWTLSHALDDMQVEVLSYYLCSHTYMCTLKCRSRDCALLTFAQLQRRTSSQRRRIYAHACSHINIDSCIHIKTVYVYIHTHIYKHIHV